MTFGTSVRVCAMHQWDWEAHGQIIAAGLRMVADAIDPPITSEEEAWIHRNMGGFDEKWSRRWWKQRPGLMLRPN